LREERTEIKNKKTLKGKIIKNEFLLHCHSDLKRKQIVITDNHHHILFNSIIIINADIVSQIANIFHDEIPSFVVFLRDEERAEKRTGGVACSLLALRRAIVIS